MLQFFNMNDLLLADKCILVTGAARRVGRILALACAQAGANVVIHHGHSEEAAKSLQDEINGLGCQAWIFKADLNDSNQTRELIPQINESTPLQGLVNSAAIFEPLSLEQTTLKEWEKHFAINLTAPFLLSQAFARQAKDGGRIVNILDWRALRPGADHFPYAFSKASLAAMTKSVAVALAPKIPVNGLALGAVLPPSDGTRNPEIIKNVPMKRWASEHEVEEALIFLLTCPTYITGEIIHVDGGRHLV